jgi:hypothetical protein
MKGEKGVRGKTHVITWKWLPLQYDLMSFLRRFVETRHQEMQIDGQGAHDDDFARMGTNDVCGLLGAVLGKILPAAQRRVL